MEKDLRNIRKPVMEVIQCTTKGTLFNQSKEEYLTTILKILEWSFFYLLSSFGYGYGWILFLASIYHTRSQKQKSNNPIISSQDFLDSCNGLTCLPSWVSFPDFDRVNWINRILHQTWPNINLFGTDFFKRFIEPKIQNSLEKLDIKQLMAFEIQSVDLGTMPAQLEGVKVYDTKYNFDKQSEEVILDLDLQYSGDAKIIFSVQGLFAEISSIKFQGIMRAQLKPLVNCVPFIGGVELYFLDKPSLEYSLGGIGNLADAPGISKIVRSLVDDMISSKMVWPNRLRFSLPKYKKPTIPLVPAGALTITLIEGRNLVKRDTYFGGSGKSDPYAIISLGQRKVSFKDKYVSADLNPKWNYSSTFAVEQPKGHTLNIEVYDFDKASTDDFLGKAFLPLVDVIEGKILDKWIPLSGVESGEVRAFCEWKVARKASYLSCQDLNGLYLVSVFVHGCENLAGGKENGSLLYPNCKIELTNLSAKAEFTTGSKNKTENPKFEQGYIFSSDDLQNDQLNFLVSDTKTKDTNLGNINIPICCLRGSPNQEVNNKTWPLEGKYSNAKITLSMKLYGVE